MATFGEMKTWVSKRLQDPNNTAVSSSDVGDMINQAIGNWKRRRFYFNEKTSLVVLSESDPSIPLPTDFFIPSIDDCFVIEYSGIRYVLSKVSEQYYNGMYLSNGIGQPFWFSKQANAGYQVYPIPDKDYDLRCFYLKQYDDLVNDSDENDWTNEARELIQYQALAYGSRDFRQDAEMFAAFQAEANSEYQNLLLQTRKENATGRLTLNSVLTTY